MTKVLESKYLKHQKYSLCRMAHFGNNIDDATGLVIDAFVYIT